MRTMNEYQAQLLWQQFLAAPGAADTASAVAGCPVEEVAPGEFLLAWAESVNGTPAVPAPALAIEENGRIAEQPEQPEQPDTTWPNNAPWRKPKNWDLWPERQRERWLAQQGRTKKEFDKCALRVHTAAYKIQVEPEWIYRSAVGTDPHVVDNPAPNAWFIRWGFARMGVRHDHLGDLKKYITERKAKAGVK